MVPENEVRDMTLSAASFRKALEQLNPHAAKFHDEHGIQLQPQPSLSHIYKRTVNAYKNQHPGTIGCCLVEETVHCGKVREPTDYEYFIHHTCQHKD
jgi:hypothetical protein